jgi:uncharacterized protein with GYD domain
MNSLSVQFVDLNSKGRSMAQYLVQVAYTQEALATLINNPQDRMLVVSKVVKKLGGKVVNGWFTLGDYDTMVIANLPDNVAAAAFALSIGGGGACKSVKTTALLTIAEGMEAMKAASTVGYKPPVS